MAAPLERLEELVHPALGVSEDEDLIGLVPAKQLFERLDLVLLEDLDVDLLDGLYGPLLRLDRDLHGLAGEAISEVADLARQGRAEERGLPDGRKMAQQAADLGGEAHVEEPVPFVEDDDPHAAQIERSALDVVKEPSRGADDDRRAALQRSLLRTVRHAAVDRGLVRVSVAADRAELARHLERELAGGDHDERLWPLLRDVDALEDRDGERGGLAGPGLRLREYVLAALQRGYRLGLDGGGSDESELGDGARDVWVDGEPAERGERWGEGQCVSGFDPNSSRYNAPRTRSLPLVAV